MNGNERNPREIPVKVKSPGTHAAGLARGLLCFLLSILLFSFIIAALASFTAARIFDERGIEKIVSGTDILTLSAADIPPFIATPDALRANPDATVLDAFYFAAQRSGLNLTPYEIREIYEESTLDEFLTKHIAELAVYVGTGEPPELPTTDELKQVFSENTQLISRVTGRPLTDYEIDRINEEIEKAEPVLQVISDMTGDTSTAGIISPQLKLLMSPFLPLIFALLALACAVLIFLVNAKLRASLKWFGFTLLCSGITIAAAAYIISAGAFFGRHGFYRTLVRSLSQAVANDFFMLSALLFASGLVCLFFGFLTVRSKKR